MIIYAVVLTQLDLSIEIITNYKLNSTDIIRPDFRVYGSLLITRKKSF